MTTLNFVGHSPIKPKNKVWLGIFKPRKMLYGLIFSRILSNLHQIVWVSVEDHPGRYHNLKQTEDSTVAAAILDFIFGPYFSGKTTLLWHQFYTLTEYWVPELYKNCAVGISVGKQHFCGISFIHWQNIESQNCIRTVWLAFQWENNTFVASVLYTDRILSPRTV